HPPQSKEFKTGTEKAFLDFGKNASPEEYFQSLMELGEQVCLPRPLCGRCPVNNFCSAYLNGIQDEIPKRRMRKNAVRFFWYFLILKKGDSLYLMQNRNRPFLKDAWIFPDVLSETELSDEELRAEFENGRNIRARNLNYLGSKSHAVTFRRIKAHAIHANTFKVQGSDGRWLLPAELNQIHTSSIVKKILQLL
ncbi:MAG TPA: hypothetical protein VLH08_21150, partial [Acidobacteriota bacterium]|nr:hypothetical protein [Acidobacteriota bacterium]